MSEHSPNIDASGGLSTGAFLEWECPLCGQTGAVIADDERPEDHAVESLLSHVRSSDDDVHGPFPSYPDGFEAESLSERIK